MSNKLLFSKAKPPLAIAAACQLCKFNAMFVPSGVSSPELRLSSGDLLKGEGTIARYISRNAPSVGLYVTHSADALAAAEVDQWIEFAEKELSADTEATFTVLDAQLALRAYLAGRCISLADLTAWQVLKRSPTFTAEYDRVATSSFTADSKFPRLVRWFRFLETIPELQKGVQALSGGPPRPAAASTEAESSKASSQGSFEIELPGAEEGKVVTRFPPEPSGFLHVGHAKAALLNDYYARRFKGKLILRFDDTNPSKEKEDFVVNIFRDLDTLGIKPDVVSYSSDYFDLCLQMCEKMLKEGKAYVDDTPVEKMRAERMNGIESEKRSAPAEENLALWKEMVQATERGLSCCVRAKMDMQALNKAMRDPVMYRCNLTPHHRTGDKYKLYPTYDFCCPIVDSVEGVTHALRTSEYHDRNDQYYWFCDAMGIRKPHIWDYSRLNFVYTLLSKRKLQFFVDKGIVGGWDDPRFPTVQGIMRRGLRIEALREFILGLGASKALNLMEWDKIWTINKKFIDPIVPRYTAITAKDRVLVELTDGPSAVEGRSLPRHKKNPDLGRKVVNFYRFVWLEYEDVAACKEGEEVTLMDWGNAILDKIEKDEQGKPVKVVAHLNLAGNFKTTEKKLTWLSNVEDDLVSVKMVDYDYLITKKKLEEEDNFENFINPTTLYETLAVGDPNLRNLQRGETIQLERKGYFVCDQVYLRPGNPVVLLNIPDGRARAVPLKPVFGAIPAK